MFVFHLDSLSQVVKAVASKMLHYWYIYFHPFNLPLTSISFWLQFPSRTDSLCFLEVLCHARLFKKKKKKNMLK